MPNQFTTNPQSIQERFNNFISAPDIQTGCWIWKGSSRNGYGQFRGKGSIMEQAHRVSYKLYKGPIPPGFLVLHKCDNPPCVNPAHLFLGTQKHNMEDMIKKGRKITARGSQCSYAKLTEGQVKAIRKDGRPYPAIAKQYGITVTTVSSITNGYNWKHVD